MGKAHEGELSDQAGKHVIELDEIRKARDNAVQKKADCEKLLHDLTEAQAVRLEGIHDQLQLLKEHNATLTRALDAKHQSSEDAVKAFMEQVGNTMQALRQDNQDTPANVYAALDLDDDHIGSSEHANVHGFTFLEPKARSKRHGHSKSRARNHTLEAHKEPKIKDSDPKGKAEDLHVTEKVADTTSATTMESEANQLISDVLVVKNKYESSLLSNKDYSLEVLALVRAYTSIFPSRRILRELGGHLVETDEAGHADDHSDTLVVVGKSTSSSDEPALLTPQESSVGYHDDKAEDSGSDAGFALFN